jgi:hypothetical protein
MIYQDKLRLASEAKVSLGTVDKWLKGGAVTKANEAALVRAKQALGLSIENPTKDEIDGQA